jgi:hypothetical protein
MSKNGTSALTVSKPGSNGSSKIEKAAEKAVETLVASIPPVEKKVEEEVVLPPVAEAAPVVEAKPVVIRELTLQEKINKIENLQLIVEKRERLVGTRSELEKFQTSSNDFNCTLRLNDSDGNVFSTSFTPGVKKVVEFLKGSFDSSIESIEDQIKF